MDSSGNMKSQTCDPLFYPGVIRSVTQPIDLSVSQAGKEYKIHLAVGEYTIQEDGSFK
jgi:hypothetical protein